MRAATLLSSSFIWTKLRDVDELRPTPPDQCGLALALPMDRAALENGLSGGPYADYLGRGLSRGNAAELWSSSFRAVAESGRSLVDHARSLGVEVHENATLEDVEMLFQTRRVVHRYSRAN